METLVGNLKAERDDDRRMIAKGHRSPSIIFSPEPPVSRAKGMAPPGNGNAKLYSDAFLGGTFKQWDFKLMIKSKESHSSETIKRLLKTNINPTEIKVGINLKDGRIFIETGSKEEVMMLKKNINEKCGGKLDVNVNRLRNPRLVIYNIPENISIENAEGTLIAQNPEIHL